MAPTASITSLLKQTVYYHLDNMSYENALFFAERWQAHDPRSSEPTFLLALCHFRLADYRSAYEASRHLGHRGIHLGCAFIFAHSCLALEKHKEGITALEKSRGLWQHKSHLGKHNSWSRLPYPDAAAVNCLLGKLYRAYDDKKKAISCFEDALKTNPLMWDAFTNLCDMGVNVRIPNVFRSSETFLRNFDQDGTTASNEAKEASLPNQSEPLSKKSLVQSAVQAQEANDPFDLQRPPAFQDMPSGSITILEGGENDFLSKITAARSRITAFAPTTGNMSDGMETPPAPAVSVEVQASRIGFTQDPPQAPVRKTRAAQAVEPGFADAPPKMSYRLGTFKRRERPQDEPVELLADPPSSLLRASTLSISASERKRTVSGHPVHPRPVQPDESSAPQRRSARLNTVLPRSGVGKINSGAATIGATRELKKARPPISRIMRPGSGTSTVGRVLSGNRKPLEENSMDIDHAEAPRVKEAPTLAPVVSKPVEPEAAAKPEESLRWILDLLRKVGSGYSLSSQFQCQEALQAFRSLPRNQQDTPWVLAQMGRAQYQQAEYAEAEKSFRRVRVLAPSRLDGMEVYSTILWHLRRETDLSFLAHELVDAAWHSPQAWCALGNAWSLALDHEQALRCFKRATQLDPKFAYAFTLQGHEHVANEEYDKALTAYRHAISADRRHYNAYYGIGKVYEKLGNYEKAYMHYHSASIIHPTNAVLICCIGTVLEKQKQIVPALQFFSKAVDLAPRAAQTRFKKARALLAIGHFEAAQRELMVLRDLAPEEARVHFLLGKLAKTLNDKHAAVRHFATALSLDPKASQQIKEAIQSIEDDEYQDTSMTH